MLFNRIIYTCFNGFGILDLSPRFYIINWHTLNKLHPSFKKTPPESIVFILNQSSLAIKLQSNLNETNKLLLLLSYILLHDINLISACNLIKLNEYLLNGNGFDFFFYLFILSFISGYHFIHIWNIIIRYSQQFWYCYRSTHVICSRMESYICKWCSYNY